MKNPTTIPIKLQIKSSTSKLLPNTICSSSATSGMAMDTTKIFFLLTLPVTKGRNRPNGKNITMFPMSMVLTQLPIVNSPDNAFMSDGTKLNPPKLKIGNISSHQPKKTPSKKYNQKFAGKTTRLINPVR